MIFVDKIKYNKPKNTIMTKKNFLIFLALFFFISCSDSDKEINPEFKLEIYGQSYNLTEGVLWENEPSVVIEKAPFIYLDTYINSASLEITDTVVGFTKGDGEQTLGNFMLSLYEEGLHYDETLGSTNGEAACICLHLNSKDSETLTMGTYSFSEEKAENTFSGYVSSNYNTGETTISAKITEGELTIEKSDENYSISFVCKTSFGGVIKGKYLGKLSKTKVPLEKSTFYENISLDGLLDTVVSTQIWGGGVPIESKSLDTRNGKAFLLTSSGKAQTAATTGKENVDIALVWDKEDESLYFESPIKMRSLLGHSDSYSFPCNTIYMKAPDSFTDEDFKNIEETGFSMDIVDEKVVVDTKNFRPMYMFFETGAGIKGIMHIKAFYPLGETETSDWGGYLVMKYPVNPSLLIDIKCPSNFVNPQIR